MADTATTQREQAQVEEQARVEADRRFHRQWLEEQRDAYPQFAHSYQRQIERHDKAEKVERAAITPVYFSNGAAIAGAEPGHDPTVAEANAKTADERDDSRQGADNRPPSETIREVAISQPSGVDGEVATAEGEPDDDKKPKRAATK